MLLTQPSPYSTMNILDIIDKMVCSEERCSNALVVPDSRELGICSPCRNDKFPKHLPDSQWMYYWRTYVERKNS